MTTARRAVNGFVAAALLAVLLTFGGTTFAQTPAAPKSVKIVALGDSLTAGYQLPPDDAFPVQLEKALRTRGIPAEVVNAGVSGDTTADGRDRLAWAVPADADAVILELGANDALRGLDPAAARANLSAIIETLQKQGKQILLAGMIAPRAMGDAYTKPFDAMYAELATKYRLVFFPLFISPIMDDAKLRLADGLHPTGKGVAAIVAAILPKVDDLLARVRSAS